MASSGDTQPSGGGRDTYLAHLQTLEVDPASLAVNERGTISPPHASPAGLERLPRIALDGEGRELRIEDEVARGGMGVIHHATQVPLDRRVAVKRPVASDRARAGLISEALVTGALQHPNVVPVHALGRDAEGEPLLVMRFIEGTRWSERLTPLFPEQRSGDDDPVDEHLRILIQVCHAVELAHAKRILHLDLKPDNVMLGQYGEVYVLDWGLARAMDDHAPARLPMASDIRHVAGTPAYMAPEMAAGDGELIAEHSDVYLLGAILHELITGKAPHAAERVIDSLASSFTSAEVAFDEAVPQELAGICRRAMRFVPEDRYGAVRDVRDDLLGFLRHRSSVRAVEAARVRIAALVAAEDEEAYAELVAEARFGLRQALAEWADNVEAQQTRRTLVDLVVEWHLARDDLRGAQAALHDLPEPDEGLSERIRARAEELAIHDAAKEHELEALREMARQTQLVRGPGLTRRVVLMMIGIGVPIAVLTMLRVVYGRRAGYPEATGLAVFFLAMVAAMQVTRREEATLMARKLGLAVASAALSIIAVLSMCWYAEVSLTTALALILITPSAMLGMGAIIVEPVFAVSVLPLVVGAIAILSSPPIWRGPIFAVAVTSAIAGAARAWGKAQGEREGDAES